MQASRRTAPASCRGALCLSTDLLLWAPSRLVVTQQTGSRTTRLPTHPLTHMSHDGMQVLSQNVIVGSLPSSWSGGFAVANTIDLDQNNITGSLPAAWGNSSSALPQLLNLVSPELLQCMPRTCTRCRGQQQQPHRGN